MDFRLSDETLEWKEYCRKFAREVIRPAAPQHDREESVPYEVMQRGLRVEARRPRLDPVAAERPRGAQGRHLRRGAPLGLRRHRARDLRLLAVRRRHRLVRHAGADRPLDPRGRRQRGRPEDRRLRRHRAAGRLRRQVAAHDRQARRRRLDPERHQDLHLERRHRRRDRRRRDGRPGRSGHRGQASFIVTKDNPGLRLGHKESKLGIRASQTAEIVLEDCRVPGDALLGGEEKLQRKLERARSGKRSQRLGCARDLRDHAPDRRRLGARHRAGRLRVDARVPRGPHRERHARCSRSSASSR